MVHPPVNVRRGWRGDTDSLLGETMEGPANPGGRTATDNARVLGWVWKAIFTLFRSTVILFGARGPCRTESVGRYMQGG